MDDPRKNLKLRDLADEQLQAQIDGLRPHSVIVVHSGVIADYVRHALHDRCGRDFAETMKIITIRRPIDISQLLANARPVEVHYAARLYWDIPTAAAVGDVVARSKALWRDAP